jgi:predicted PurR-regulated permease PerM
MIGLDPKAARAVWSVLLIALLLYLTYRVKSVLIIFALAIFFSYMLYPLVRFLDRRSPSTRSRVFSIAVVYLLVIVLLVGAGTLIGTQMVEQASGLAQQLPGMLKSNQWLDKIPLPRWLAPYRARIVEVIQAQLQGGAHGAIPWAERVGTELLHLATNMVYLVLILILSFMFIKDAPTIRKNVDMLLARSPNLPILDGILDDLNFMLEHYIRALLILAILSFTAYSIFFSVTGVPYGVLLAGIDAVLEVIPLIGPIAGGVITLLVAGASGYTHLWWIAVFILAYRTFQDYVLNPYLLGEGVEVHPLLVIFGLLAGEELGGVAGMFFAIPILAATKIVLKRVWDIHETGRPQGLATVKHMPKLPFTQAPDKPDGDG